MYYIIGIRRGACNELFKMSFWDWESDLFDENKNKCFPWRGEWDIGNVAAYDGVQMEGKVLGGQVIQFFQHNLLNIFLYWLKSSSLP